MQRIVAFSGGKDSSAMLLRMIELDMPIDKIVFADTTLEFPEMYKFIDTMEQHIGREIIRVKPKTTFFKYFYKPFCRGKHEGQIHGFPFVVATVGVAESLKSIL